MNPERNPCSFIFFFFILFFVFLQVAYARVIPDRTRIIFKGDKDTSSFSVLNDDPTTPFLAQAWLEDINGNKADIPFSVVPPLQRIEADSRSMIKIRMLTPSVVPQDRESVFMFILREIPPKTPARNNIRVNLQSKIKMFYRPENLISIPDEERWKKVTIMTGKDEYIITNSSPFYLSLSSVSGQNKKAVNASFPLVPPFESRTIRAVVTESPWISYIDDYGALKKMNFSCTGKLCHVTQ